MSGDEMASAFFMCLSMVLVGLSVWVIMTDEYEVDMVKTCTQENISYRCKIHNGETLFFCDTKEECNKKCEEARNR